MPAEQAYEVLASCLSTESGQSLQDGQVGLTGTVVLDTAPLSDAELVTPRLPQERLDDRRLPDPGLAGDEDDLPFTAHRPAEAGAQLPQLALASDHQRRWPENEVRRRGRAARGFVGRR